MRRETLVAEGTESFTWPDGGQTPFFGFRAPATISLAAVTSPPTRWETASFPGSTGSRFLAAAGNPNIVDELKKGKELGGTTYTVHLDGYNQMDMITGKGPSGERLARAARPCGSVSQWRPRGFLRLPAKIRSQR